MTAGSREIAGEHNTHCDRNSLGIFGMLANFVAFAYRGLADGILRGDPTGAVVEDLQETHLGPLYQPRLPRLVHLVHYPPLHLAN